jgi:hypothetical protein
MPESTESRLRAILLVYFPMFIATLSLLTSVYNGYLNNRFLDFSQRNAGRTEYLRTCKDIIDAYFQIKARMTALSAAGEKAGASTSVQMDVASAVAKFGALGTYLANLRDEAARVRYTQVTTDLEKLSADAPHLSIDQLNKRYEAPDREFSAMNSDCIKSAQELPL